MYDILKQITKRAIDWRLKYICDSQPDLIHQESDVKCYLFYNIQSMLYEHQVSDTFIIHTETQVENYTPEESKRALLDLGIYNREEYNKNRFAKPIVAIEIKTSDAPRPKKAEGKNLHSIFMKQFKKAKADYDRLLKLDIHYKYLVFVDTENISEEWSKERAEFFHKELSSEKVKCFYYRCNKRY